MDPAITAVLITAVVSIGGSWLVAHTSGRTSGTAAAEAVIEDQRAEIESLRARVAHLEAKAETDARIKRAMGDHIDILEAHIWARKDPPPPPRPDGI